MITMRNAAGEQVPDPDYYPDDVVRVTDVYGRRLYVRLAHLDDGRVFLTRFTPQGRRYVNRPGNEGRRYPIHRENIVYSRKETP